MVSPQQVFVVVPHRLCRGAPLPGLHLQLRSDQNTVEQTLQHDETGEYKYLRDRLVSVQQPHGFLSVKRARCRLGLVLENVLPVVLSGSLCG